MRIDARISYVLDSCSFPCASTRLGPQTVICRCEPRSFQWRACLAALVYYTRICGSRPVAQPGKWQSLSLSMRGNGPVDPRVYALPPPLPHNNTTTRHAASSTSTTTSIARAPSYSARSIYSFSYLLSSGFLVIRHIQVPSRGTRAVRLHIWKDCKTLLLRNGSVYRPAPAP
jgi:hypothetical protein